MRGRAASALSIVIMLETESGEEAQRQLATLPLVQRGVTSFEVTELVLAS
jgi:hypothetical protein